MVAATDEGLMCLVAGMNVVRFAPSLVIPDEDILEGLALERGIAKVVAAETAESVTFMNLIRPIEQKDFAALYQIAKSLVLVSPLPVDKTLLQNKIEISQKSFATKVSRAGDEGYLFVLEDTLTGQILGTSGIEAKVGVTDPHHYTASGTRLT